MTRDEELRRIAREVAQDDPFPWYTANRDRIDTTNPVDVAYIAAASPDVVLALLDDLAEMRALNRQLENDIERLGRSHDRVVEKVEQARRQRDEARATVARVEALADPEVFAQRLYWQGSLSDDLIPLVQWNASRVVSVTIDPPDDAWAANEAAGAKRGVPWWDRESGKRVRDAERHAAGVGWDLAHAEMCPIGRATCSWHQPITADAQAGRLREALDSDPHTGTDDASEGAGQGTDEPAGSDWHSGPVETREAGRTAHSKRDEGQR